MILESLLAMTLNLYMEARGEGIQGMHLVADTTLTRVHSDKWPDTVEDVVLQPHQFSWTAENGVDDLQDMISLQHKILDNAQPSDIASYRQAEAVARKVLSKGYKPRYRFHFYHTKKVRPHWANKMHYAHTYKNHIFYRSRK